MCNSKNSKYFSTLPQWDSNNLQAQGIKGTNMLLQSGLSAPTLSPPSSPPPSSSSPPHQHIPTPWHCNCQDGFSSASHDATRPEWPHPRMSSMLRNVYVKLRRMALICQGSCTHFPFKWIKKWEWCAGTFFFFLANNEHYSRVSVLLCKCENIAPVVSPAAGQSPKRPPTEKQNRVWGSADEFPKYPALQERKSGFLYLYSLDSDSRGERPEASPVMTET